MKSIFNPNDSKEFIDRINKLKPDAKPVWGKMSVSQMLAHCQQPLRVAVGELKLKRGLIGLLFGRIAKKKLLAPGDFEKNLPTSPAFVIQDQRTFDKEKESLIKLVIKLSHGGEAIISKEPHPFFGKLTINEWDLLQVKHLDHHLRQFGT